MSFLKLVGGTDVQNASLKASANSKNNSVQMDVADLKAQKRIVVDRILRLEIMPGRSAKSLIEELATLREQDDSGERFIRGYEICQLLTDEGIWVVHPDDSHEPAFVWSPEKLLKACPSLKGFENILTDLLLG